MTQGYLAHSKGLLAGGHHPHPIPWKQGTVAALVSIAREVWAQSVVQVGMWILDDPWCTQQEFIKSSRGRSHSTTLKNGLFAHEQTAP